MACPAPKRRRVDSQGDLSHLVSRPAGGPPSTDSILGNTAEDTASIMPRRPSRRKVAFRLKWPAMDCPVEIFEKIASYLPRRNVQNMRLVNREFEKKVSAYYFRSVVLPFHPRVLASVDEKGDMSLRDSKVVNQVLSGAAIFQSWGAQINHFALALEVNEAELAYPPIKFDHTLVKTFWGFYLWPNDEYKRYSDLEGIETVADETFRLREALQQLVNARELGISCDSGRGYLRGEDNTLTHPPRLGKVLHGARYEPQLAPKLEDARIKNGLPFEEGRSTRYLMLKKLVLDQGYEEDQVEEIIGLIDGYPASPVSESPQMNGTAPGSVPRPESPGPGGQRGGPRRALIDLAGPNSMTEEELALAKRLPDFLPSGYMPAHLSRAQLEMLLELQWAQRALLQSFAITIGDSLVPGTFANVTRFTIARIPSSELALLGTPAVWNALPNVERLTLGVIPDWRVFQKSTTLGQVEEQTATPSGACGPVFQFLTNFISQAPRITSVHFEWICGGELASGTSQRDRYVLPAPVAETQAALLQRSTFGRKNYGLIWLPFVKHLSFKNCWFTPAVLVQLIHHHSHAGRLETLELESVSLTGPPVSRPTFSIYTNSSPIESHWPWPLSVGGVPNHQYRLIRPDPDPNSPWHQMGGNVHANLVHANPHLAGLAALAWPNVPPLAQPALHHQPIGTFLLPPPAAATTPPPTMPPPPPPIAGPPPFYFPPAPRQPYTAVEGIPIPPLLSWPHVLDLVAPGETRPARSTVLKTSGFSGLAGDPNEPSEFTVLRKELAKIIPRSASATMAGVNTKTPSLKRINLKSCGYVLVDLDHINNWEIVPHNAFRVQRPKAIVATLRVLDATSQNGRGDRYLGTILNFCNELETEILTDFFGMRFGWEGVYDKKIMAAAKADGNPTYGVGRFTGSLSDTSVREHDPVVEDPLAQHDDE